MIKIDYNKNILSFIIRLYSIPCQYVFSEAEYRCGRACEKLLGDAKTYWGVFAVSSKWLKRPTH